MKCNVDTGEIKKTSNHRHWLSKQRQRNQWRITSQQLQLW